MALTDHVADPESEDEDAVNRGYRALGCQEGRPFDSIMNA